MSTLSALLLEEPLSVLSADQPFPDAVHLALRSDGIVGSGSASDPFNAGTQLARAGLGSIQSEESGPHVTTVSVNTREPHGLKTYDVVEIAGISGDEARYFNGRFLVSVVSETVFQYEIQTPPSAPSVSGLASYAKIIWLFDAIMRRLPAFTMVRLGPGIFETRGYVEDSAIGWSAKAGQKLIGAGRDATILKCVYAISGTYQGAISHFYGYAVDGFETADLSIDGNIFAQPYDPITKGAVAVTGSHTRVRSIKVSHFGTHRNGTECFPIAVGGSSPHFYSRDRASVDCRIEDCVAERPDPGGLYVNTLFVSISNEYSDGVPRYPRAGVVRNCYASGEFAHRPVSITGISFSGGVAHVTSREPHGRQNGDWVTIDGAVEDGIFSNTYNGSFKISNATATGFDFTPAGTPVNPVPGGDIVMDRFTGRLVPVLTLERDAMDATIAILTSSRPHGRKPGEMIAIAPVALPEGAEAYFGWLRILGDEDRGVVSSCVLRYRMTTEPAVALVDESAQAFFGPASQATVGDGGSEAVVEGNRVFDVSKGGPYQDTWNSRDTTVRHNFESNVYCGPNRTFEGGSYYFFDNSLRPQQMLQSPVSYDPLTATNTFWLQNAKSLVVDGALLAVGDFIYIRGALSSAYPFNSYLTTYSGKVAVTAIKGLTFSLPGSPPLNGLNCQGSPVFEKTFGTKVKSGSSLVRSAIDSSKAVFTTLRPHGLRIGDSITVAGARVSSGSNPFNGANVITNVTDTTFEYSCSGTGPDASGSPVFGTEQPAFSLTRAGNTATFTAANPTGLMVGQVILIHDASDSSFNGIFRVKSVSTDGKIFTYSTRAASGGSSASGAAFTVFLPISSVAVDGWVFRLTFAEPHGFEPMDAISVWGASETLAGEFNRSFRVQSVSECALEVYLEFSHTGAPTGTIMCASQNSTPLVRSVDAGGRVLGTFTSDAPAPAGQVLFDPQSASRRLISVFGAVVNGTYVNPYNNVVEVISSDQRSITFVLSDDEGVVFGDPKGHAAGAPLCAFAEATPLTVNGTTGTFHTVYPHGLDVGQTVEIRDPVGKSTPFTGRFRITAIPTETSFSWEYPVAPGENGPPGSTFYPLWRNVRHVIENNTVELGNAPHPASQPSLANVGIIERGDTRNLLVFENGLRTLPSQDTPYAVALSATGAENIVVQNNVIENLREGNAFDGTAWRSLANSPSQAATYFSNFKGNGDPLPGYEIVRSTLAIENPGFAGKIDDVLSTVL